MIAQLIQLKAGFLLTQTASNISQEKNQLIKRFSLKTCSYRIGGVFICVLSQILLCMPQHSYAQQDAATVYSEAEAVYEGSGTTPGMRSPAFGTLNDQGNYIWMQGNRDEGRYWGDFVVEGINVINQDFNKSVEASKDAAGALDMTKIAQVDPLQLTAPGTLAIEVSGAQIINIISRLSILRGGAGSLGLIGAAMDRNRNPKGRMLYADNSGNRATDAGSDQGAGSSENWYGNLGIFVNGTYATGDVDTTSRQPGFDFDGYSITAGVDYRFTDNFVLGLAVGYATTDADLDDSRGKVDVDGYHVSLYSTHYFSNFYFDAIVSYGKDKYDSTRRFAYTGMTPTSEGLEAYTVDNAGKGKFDANAGSFSVGAGYDFNFKGFNIGPYARANYLRVHFDSYTEEPASTNNGTDPGAGNNGYSLMIKFDDYDIDSFVSNLGLQTSYTLNTNFAVLVPQVGFNWAHEFSNDSRTITSRLINANNFQFYPNNITGEPLGTVQDAVLFQTDGPDRNYYNLAGGLSAVFPHGISAFGYYSTVLGLKNITMHLFTLGLRYEF